jgi:nucleoid DNA-binding protein
MNLREWARATHKVLSEQREEGGAALSGDVVEQVLRIAISTLIDALADGSDLRIDALGRLWVEEKAARRVVSNLAGKRRVYAVGDRRIVRFRAARGLVARLNGQSLAEEPEFVRERELGVAKLPKAIRDLDDTG